MSIAAAGLMFKWSEVKWEECSIEWCTGNAFNSVLCFHRLIAERQVSIFTCLHLNSHLIAHTSYMNYPSVYAYMCSEFVNWLPSFFHILEFKSNEQIKLQFKEMQNNYILVSKVLLHPGQQKECYFIILIV